MTLAQPMPALSCQGLRKRYVGEREFTLGAGSDGLSFSVARGELFALVGPSGCGKTTTLQIIGGFVPADAGRVLINGRDVTESAPYARPTNTVFQSYALFPHLSVGANVEFGLRMEQVHGRERRRRAAEALDLVGLSGLEKRRIAELSGGQQQRVALARAIVKRPAVLLLDEPLGALDLQLRKQMQGELVRLKEATGTTFVHVTHDQEEAFAIADRIGVMKDGELVQVDEPAVLYRAPGTTYVASFLDVGTIVRGRAVRNHEVLDIHGDGLTVRVPDRGGVRRPAAVLLPDRIRVFPEEGRQEHRVVGVVTRIVFAGTRYLLYVSVERGPEVRVDLRTDEVAVLGRSVAPGARVRLAWSPEDVILVEDGDP